MDSRIDKGGQSHNLLVGGCLGRLPVPLYLFLLVFLFLSPAVPVLAQSVAPTLSLEPKMQTVSAHGREVSLTVLLSPVPSATATVEVVITGGGGILTLPVILSSGQRTAAVRFITEPADIGTLSITAAAMTETGPVPAPATATVIVQDLLLVRLTPLTPVVPNAGEVRLRAEVVPSAPGETVEVFLLATRAADGVLQEVPLEFSPVLRTTEVVFSGGGLHPQGSDPQGTWNFTAVVIPTQTVDPFVEPVTVIVRGQGMALFLLAGGMLNGVDPVAGTLSVGSALSMVAELGETNAQGAYASGGVTLPVTATFSITAFVQGESAEVLSSQSYTVEVPAGSGSGLLEIPGADLQEAGKVVFTFGHIASIGRRIRGFPLDDDGRIVAISRDSTGVSASSNIWEHYDSVTMLGQILHVVEPPPPPPPDTGEPPEVRLVAIDTADAGAMELISVRTDRAPTVAVTLTVVARQGVIRTVEVSPGVFGGVLVTTSRIITVQVNLAPNDLSPVAAFPEPLSIGTYLMQLHSANPSTAVEFVDPVPSILQRSFNFGSPSIFMFDAVVHMVLTRAAMRPLQAGQEVTVEVTLEDVNGAPVSMPASLGLDLLAEIDSPGTEPPVSRFLVIEQGESTARGTFTLSAAGLWRISASRVLDARDGVRYVRPFDVRNALQVEVGPQLLLRPSSSVLSFGSTAVLEVSLDSAPRTAVSITVSGQRSLTAPPITIDPNVSVGNPNPNSNPNPNPNPGPMPNTVMHTVTLSPPASLATVVFAPGALSPGRWNFTAEVRPAREADTRFAAAQIEVRETRTRLLAPLVRSAVLVVGQSTSLAVVHEHPSSPIPLRVFRARDGAQPEPAGDIMLYSGAESSSGTVDLQVPPLDEAGEYVYTLREPAGQDAVANEDDFQATVRVVARVVLRRTRQNQLQLNPQGEARVQVAAELVDINGSPISLASTLSLTLQAVANIVPCTPSSPVKRCSLPILIFPGESLRSVSIALPAAGTWTISVREIGQLPGFGDASRLVVPADAILPLEVAVEPRLLLLPMAPVQLFTEATRLRAEAGTAPHTTVRITVSARMPQRPAAAPVMRATTLSPSVSAAEVRFEAGVLSPGRWIFQAAAQPTTAIDTSAAIAEVVVLESSVQLLPPLQTSAASIAGQRILLPVFHERLSSPVALSLFRARDEAEPERVAGIMLSDNADGMDDIAVQLPAEAGRYSYTLREPLGQDAVGNEGDFRALVRVLADVQLGLAAKGVSRSAETTVQATLQDISGNAISLASPLKLNLRAAIDTGAGEAVVMPVTSALVIAARATSGSVSFALPPGDWIVSVTGTTPAAVADMVIPVGRIEPLPVIVREPGDLPTLELRLLARALVAGLPAVLAVTTDFAPDTTATVTVTASRMPGASATSQTVVLSPMVSSATAIFPPSDLAPGRWLFRAAAVPMNVLDVSSAAAQLAVLQAKIRLLPPLVSSASVVAMEGLRIALAVTYEPPALPVTLDILRSRGGGEYEPAGRLLLPPIPAEVISQALTTLFTYVTAPAAGEYVFVLREPMEQDVIVNEDDFQMLVRVLADVQLGLAMEGVSRSTETTVRALLVDGNGRSASLSSTLVLTLQAMTDTMAVTAALRIAPGEASGSAALALAPGDWTVSVIEVAPAAVAPLVVSPGRIDSLPVLVRAPRALPALSLSLQTAAVLAAGISPTVLSATAEPPPDTTVTVVVTALRIPDGTTATKTVTLSPATDSAPAVFPPDDLGPGRWTLTARAAPANVLQTASPALELTVLEARIRLLPPLTATVSLTAGQSTLVTIVHERPSLPFSLPLLRVLEGYEQPERRVSLLLLDAASGAAQEDAAVLDFETGALPRAGEYVYTLSELAGQNVIVNEEDFSVTVRAAADIVLRRAGAGMPVTTQPLRIEAALQDISGNALVLPSTVALSLQAAFGASTSTVTVLPVTGSLTVSPGNSTGSLSLFLPAAGDWSIMVTDTGLAPHLVVPAAQILPLAAAVGPRLQLQPEIAVLPTNSTAVLRAAADSAPHTAVEITVSARMPGAMAMPMTRSITLSPAVSSAAVHFDAGALRSGRWIFTAEAVPAEAIDTRFSTTTITIFAVRIHIEEPLEQNLDIVVGQGVRVEAVFQAPPAPVTLNIFRSDGTAPELAGNLTVPSPGGGAPAVTAGFDTERLAQAGTYLYTLREPEGQDVVANENDFSVTVRAVADAVLRRMTADAVLVNRPLRIEAALQDINGNALALPSTVALSLQAAFDASTGAVTALPVTGSLTISAGSSTGSSSLLLPAAGDWNIAVTDIGLAPHLVVPAAQILRLAAAVGPRLQLQTETALLPMNRTAVLRAAADFAPHTAVEITVSARMPGVMAMPVTRSVTLSPAASSAAVHFDAGVLRPGRWIFTAEAMPAEVIDTRFSTATITIFAARIHIEEPLEQSLDIVVGQGVRVEAVFQAPPVPVTLDIFRSDGTAPEIAGNLTVPSPGGGASTVTAGSDTEGLAQAGAYTYTLREPAGQDVVANENDFSVTVRAVADAVLRRMTADAALVNRPLRIEAVLRDINGNALALPSTVALSLQAAFDASTSTVTVLPVTSSLTISPGNSTGSLSLFLPAAGDWRVTVTDIEGPGRGLVVPAERVDSLLLAVDIGFRIALEPLRAFPGERVELTLELQEPFASPLSVEVAVRAPTSAREPAIVRVEPGRRRGVATFVPDAEPGIWVLTATRSNALRIAGAQEELEVLPVNLPALAAPFGTIDAEDLVLALRYLVLCAAVHGAQVLPSACTGLRSPSDLHSNLGSSSYDLDVLPMLVLPDVTGDLAADTKDILLLLEALSGISPALLVPADTPQQRVRLRILSQLLLE